MYITNGPPITIKVPNGHLYVSCEMVWCAQGSLLYLMKMSAGRCLPGKLAVGRFDDTEHGGAPFKEMPTTDGWQTPSVQGPVSKLSSVYGRRSMTYGRPSLAHVSSSLAASKHLDAV